MEDILQLCKKKKKKKKESVKKCLKIRRTEEAHKVMYQIPLASRVTTFALNSHSTAMKALK